MSSYDWSFWTEVSLYLYDVVEDDVVAILATKPTVLPSDPPPLDHLMDRTEVVTVQPIDTGSDTDA